MNTCIALGFFDGVHTAHQNLISTSVNIAAIKSLEPIVLSFDNPPISVLNKGNPELITDNAEKSRLIGLLGAKVHFLSTDSSLLSMSDESFIKEILCKKFSAKHVVCGYNYHFGKFGAGNAETLIALGKSYGFETTVIDETVYNGISVSSSRIRSLIKEGKIKEANKLLGRNFAFSGTVSEGKKLGRTLGFPTANVLPSPSIVRPLNGVYLTKVFVDGKSYKAITNVGTNPTLGDYFRSETYIPEFSGNLYGTCLRIEFIDFIRPEKRFNDIDSLCAQIQKDVRILEGNELS